VPCGEPPPDETVVIVYKAPKKGGTGPDKNDPDTTKAKAKHAAKSNGDGTYESKNGTAPPKPNATPAEAFDEYMQVETGEVAYKVCWAPVPGCPPE
jgi:hypothetical protein